ncbi:ATP/GTP-binding protein [Promicromonospora sp. AC04]|uniref:ATP/GTP-binding protein n=1 Tax=Promicromonospora sp. AC04 TaxID=2135723 RepID=UPI0011B1FEF5|nr:ATP/GTP-binding protein [Promicromonospora sp. AC04]
MDLNPIDIGIVPEEGPDRVGIVGMPQWMWVNEPAENTFGPITRKATAGSVTVTATAKVDKVVWDMGDGTSVTCVGTGTPYEDRYDTMDSPDCGHRYSKQGKYEVTATSYWTVEWEGMGQSGTIPLDFTRTANIVMGEAQVITQ